MNAKISWLNKILRRSVLLLLLAVVFVLLGAWLQAKVLPRLAQRIALSKLRDLGYPDAALQVVELDPWKLTLRDVTLDHDKKFRIAHLKLTFSPRSLWQGKFDELTIVGLRDSIASVDGQWNFGFANTATKPAGKSSPVAVSNLPAQIIDKFPFAKITLIASVLDVQVQAMNYSLPIEGVMKRVDAQRLDSQWHFQLPQGAVDLRIQLTPTRGEVTVASPQIKFPVRQNILSIAALNLQSQMQWDDHTQLKELYLQGKTGEMHWSDVMLASSTLTGSATDSGIAVAAKIFTGDGSWSVDSKFPALSQMQSQWPRFAAITSLQGNSKLPAPLQSLLRGQGVDTSRLGALQLKTTADIAVDADANWSLSLPEISLAIAPGHLGLLRGLTTATEIEDFSAKIQLHGQVDRNGFSLALSHDALLEASAIHGAMSFWGDKNSSQKAAGNIALAIMPFLEKPLIVQSRKAVPNEPAVDHYEIALVARVQNPLNFKQNNIVTQCNAMAAAGCMSFSSQEPLTLTGRISAQAQNILDASQGWEIRNATLDFPVVIDSTKSLLAEKAAKGSWSASELRMAGNNFQNFTGSLEMINKGLRATLTWLPFTEKKTQAVNLDGWIDWSGPALRGECSGKMPEIRLADPGALKKLFPRMGNVNITGNFVAEANMKIDQGRVSEPRLQLWLGDVAVSLPDSDTQITGISGGLSLKSFWPPVSPSNQIFSIKELRAGKAKLYNGFIALGIEDAQTLFLERFQWCFGEGGRVLLHPLRLHQGDDEIDLEIFIEDLSLAEWLGFLTDGKVTGTGRMYGWLPVSIAWVGERLLHFGEGFLYAKPGAGLLQLHQAAAADAVDLTKNSAQDISMSDVVRQRTLDALGDFQYDMLRFDFVKSSGNGENLICKIQAKGQGRSGDKQEIGGLSVDIPHFDRVLGDLLMFKLQLADPLQRFYSKFTKPATKPAAMMTTAPTP